MKEKEFYVIGLGVFGEAAMKKLLELKKKVIVIDKNSELINAIEDERIKAYILNATNKEALKSLGLDKALNVIVCVGNDLKSSILICSILMEFKIPNVIAKATDDRHERILRSLGIKNIARPERNGGMNAALNSVFEINLGFSSISKDYSSFDVKILNPAVVNKTLAELQLPKKFNCNIILIKRENKNKINGEPKILFPKNSFVLQLNDIIYFAAKNAFVNNIFNYLSKPKSISSKRFSIFKAKG